MFREVLIEKVTLDVRVRGSPMKPRMKTWEGRLPRASKQSVQRSYGRSLPGGLRSSEVVDWED